MKAAIKIDESMLRIVQKKVHVATKDKSIFDI